MGVPSVGIKIKSLKEALLSTHSDLTGSRALGNWRFPRRLLPILVKSQWLTTVTVQLIHKGRNGRIYSVWHLRLFRGLRSWLAESHHAQAAASTAIRSISIWESHIIIYRTTYNTRLPKSHVVSQI